jgi:hypothetical protein
MVIYTVQEQEFIQLIDYLAGEGNEFVGKML